MNNSKKILINQNIESECPICRQEDKNCNLISLPCHEHHKFHKECLCNWITSSKITKCPLCSKIIMESFIKDKLNIIIDDEDTENGSSQILKTIIFLLAVNGFFSINNK